MASENTETLYTYLRLHFEKVSRRNAGREAEKTKLAPEAPIPIAHANSN
jgi:hypothetical protein